ncbi:MAG: CAP domain-containing protein [Candidatus Sulfotelmatobacter sp.]|jgi:uncharacterized protein YkwD
MRISLRLVAFWILGFSAILAQAQVSASAAAEQRLFLSVNQVRRVQGLPGLKWNEGLALAARRHAETMARRGAAEHVFPGEPTLAARVSQAGVHFVFLSENVCQGSGAAEVQAEFLHSPNHRANILDTDMDSVGIGVVERGGQLFVVEDFSKVR